MYIFCDNRVLCAQSKLLVLLKKNSFRSFRFSTKTLVHSFSNRLKAVREFLAITEFSIYKSNEIISNSYLNLQYVFNLRTNFIPKFRKIFFVRKKNGSFSSFFFDESYDRLNIFLWNSVMQPFSDFYCDRFSFNLGVYRTNHDNFLILRNFFFKKQDIFWLLELKILNFFSSANCNWVLKNCPIDKLTLKSWFKYFKFNLVDIDYFDSFFGSNIIVSSLVNFMFTGLLRIF